MEREGKPVWLDSTEELFHRQKLKVPMLISVDCRKYHVGIRTRPWSNGRKWPGLLLHHMDARVHERRLLEKKMASGCTVRRIHIKNTRLYTVLSHIITSILKRIYVCTTWLFASNFHLILWFQVKWVQKPQMEMTLIFFLFLSSFLLMPTKT